MNRFLPNLVSQSLVEGPNVWDFEPATAIPAAVRSDKTARHRWITNKSTQHCCYSMFEGENDVARVTKPARGMDGNEAFMLHGVVGDYDSPVSRDVVQEAVENPRQCVFVPSWYERTLSGNARLLWMFEAPVRVSGNAFASAFMEFIGEAMRLQHVLPGLDKAYLDPARYYTNSCEWTEVGGIPIASAVVEGWLVEFCRKFNAKKLSPVAIPLDVAAAKLAQKYPRFAEWEGEFVEHAMGPTFWVDGSVSPKSAVVKPEGIFTFAAHATKQFYSWSDLLGKDEVAVFEANRTGEAVAEVYYDGKDYWFPDGPTWRKFGKEDITLQLKVLRGVSTKPGDDGTSQMERALSHIQMRNNILGALPMPCAPPGKRVTRAGTVLNISTVAAISPVEGTVQWGPEGEFPFISSLLDALFDPTWQRDIFLAHLSYAYQCVLEGEPMPGCGTFLVGGVGVGKTLLTQQIIGELFGGFADASRYLSGEDGFGGEMFEKGVWCVDDSTSAANEADHRKFSETTKRVVANNRFQYHVKFRMPQSIQWAGRFFVTCNRDEQSLKMIPSLDNGSLDKLCIYQIVEESPAWFQWPGGSRKAIEASVKAELPFFARWLADHKPVLGDLIKVDVRYGYKSFQYAGLVAAANSSSANAGFEEILSDWMDRWFTENPDSEWKGTAFQLHKELCSDPRNDAAMRPYTVQRVGFALMAVKSRGSIDISCSQGFLHKKLREWTIARPSGVAAPAPSKVPVRASKKKAA